MAVVQRALAGQAQDADDVAARPRLVLRDKVRQRRQLERHLALRVCEGEDEQEQEIAQATRHAGSPRDAST